MARTLPWAPNRYPTARRSDHVDVYASEKHGEVKVPDPYQWLEQNTEETEQWTTAQEKYTREFLDTNPDRLKLEDEIRKSTDYERFSAPSLKEDNRWYWSYNSGLQAQSVIYRSTDSTLPTYGSSGQTTANTEVFFDPNALSEDGTVSLATAAFSRDGKWFAYGISRSGSDFTTVYVRSTEHPLTSFGNDKRLEDEIRFVKFSSIAWTPDNSGFLYQRFPDRKSHGDAEEDKAGTETEGDRDAMLYYHKIGTKQADDTLVMKDPEHPHHMWGAGTSEVDGRWLELYTRRDTARKNMLWLADLEKTTIGPNIDWIKLVDEFEADYGVIANDGTRFYLRTNANALQYKVISVDIDDFIAKDLIPEDKDAFLEDVLVVGKDRIMTVYKRNVKDEVYIHSLATGEKLKRLEASHVGSMQVSGKRKQNWAFLTLTGFTTPGTVSKYEFKDEEKSEAGSSTVWKQTVVKGLAGSGGFTAEQIWYESKDGTKVPMFVVRHESTKLDGTAPALQYGYGGFTISISPFFSPSMLTFLRAYGAILAVPNIRGGGEFGEEWHLAGTKERKGNCFDDFIAATQWLVKNKYAGEGKVAINGGSNGGLLVAASALRAPEGTFGAAVAEVGVLDLLKFADFTIGRAWTSDYGNPHDPHDFDFVYPISPLHNVPEKKILPPTILLTADHDDRVVPLHSFKFAATLQHVRADNPNPQLIRIEKKAGHGAGKATEQKIKEAADKWGFVAQTMGLKWGL
ncbi:prolyl oligopeptidase [Stereum hirsutum FP-91666 SS1]|uniref:prolyl oligopeptidase n=1 Tax=Stereum hirsutum (strain FP-91666) TaxID=721885 RepID=UPI0004449C8C|nr:prolyl oligopeptidase [Stereum hirsutum FP-91666 SS1]EIM85490.1 prolyl oligopeptidase [Stereum hirsutum FP-91666 SS1]